MIVITRPNGAQSLANAGLIETRETTPDTLITLTNGNARRRPETVPKEEAA